MSRYSIFMGGADVYLDADESLELAVGGIVVDDLAYDVADCVVGDASYSGGLCTGVDLRAFFTGGAALGGRCLLLPLVWRFAPGVSMTARIQ
jgi:hypothetical protein